MSFHNDIYSLNYRESSTFIKEKSVFVAVRTNQYSTSLFYCHKYNTHMSCKSI